VLLSSLSKKLSAEKGFRASGIRTNIDCTDKWRHPTWLSRSWSCMPETCVLGEYEINCGDTPRTTRKRRARSPSFLHSRERHIYFIYVFSIYMYIHRFRLGSVDRAPLYRARRRFFDENAFTYLYARDIYYVCTSRLTITAESFTRRKCHKPFPRDFLYICFIHVRRYI